MLASFERSVTAQGRGGHRWVAVLMAAALLASLRAAVPAYAFGGPPTVSVKGEVTTSSTYTPAQLAALPQTTATVSIGDAHFTDTGVLLETLVSEAKPAYPTTLVNTKNELLRVTATVRGDRDAGVTFAVGELDPNFGNHPALLALTQNGRSIDDGPELVVPGDKAQFRFVRHVSEVTVGIATAPATNTSPVAGSPVEVIDGGRTVTLSSAQLAHLRSETLSVSFGGPSGVQTHTEVGPPLLDVLVAARVLPVFNPFLDLLALAGVMVPGFNPWVAAVGDDNYVATVTPAEQVLGGRPLQLSLVEDGVKLAQPRLVTDGDVKGGRYVSDVVDIYAGNGPAH